MNQDKRDSFDQASGYIKTMPYIETRLRGRVCPCNYNPISNTRPER